MADKKERSVTARREFLKLASIGTVVGGASLVLQDKPAEASDAPAAKSGKGYQETPHVRAFYESAKF